MKLISHTFKIWERINIERAQDLKEIMENQCEMVSEESTIDAIHTIRIQMKSYRAKEWYTYGINRLTRSIPLCSYTTNLATTTFLEYPQMLHKPDQRHERRHRD